MYRKLSLLLGGTFIATQSVLWTSPQPSRSQIIRGQYEDRIRRYSPIEKIYLVFAKRDDKNQFTLTQTDLLHALSFYNYSIKALSDVAGFQGVFICKLLGKKSHFNIYNYYQLTRFLSLDQKQVSQYFKSLDKSSLDKSQFQTFLRQVVFSTLHKHIKRSVIGETRNFTPSQAQFQAAISSSLHSLFQQKRHYSEADIFALRDGILHNIYEFQFDLFQSTGNYIDGVDFARSIVKYAHQSTRNNLMKRIKTNDYFNKVQISKEVYISFHIFMASKIDVLSNLLTQKGAICAKDLALLLNQQTPLKHFQEAHAAIITNLLDVDNSGFVEKKEIIGILQRLKYFTEGNEKEKNIADLVDAKIKIAWEKAAKIYSTLME